MAQVYLNSLIGISRANNGASWVSYPSTSTTITEFADKTTAQNALIVDSSDNNHQIFQEMKLASDYQSFDTTGLAPAPGDQIYFTKFIGLYRLTDTGAWQLYKGTGTTLIFSVDSATFLTTMRTNYGDGRFRIFQQLEETSTHGFNLVP